MSKPGNDACMSSPLLTHAFIDGELDANASHVCREHFKTCPRCAAEYARLRELKNLLRGSQVRYTAPDPLRFRIASFIRAGKILAKEERGKDEAPIAILVQRWMRELQRQWRLAFTALSVAAAALFLIVAPDSNQLLEDEIVATHIRSLRGFRLIDISATHRQAVAPWLREKLDFVPPVVDLEDLGFRLAGARVDIVGGHDSAAFVYSHRSYLINLFVWPSRPEAFGSARHEGYNLIHWTQGGLKFCAVSNLDFQLLQKFQEDIAARLPGANQFGG